MNPATFQWVAQGQVTASNTTNAWMTAGSKSTSQEATTIRLTTASGTDQFDAGTINVIYER
jgi:hypothetical protein